MAAPSFLFNTEREHAAEVAAGQRYNLTVIVDSTDNGGNFYYGAVQLVNQDPNNATNIIDLLDPDPCLGPSTTSACHFQAPPDPSDDNGKKLYDILLNVVDPMQSKLVVGAIYKVNVIWAYTPAPESNDRKTTSAWNKWGPVAFTAVSPTTSAAAVLSTTSATAVSSTADTTTSPSAPSSPPSSTTPSGIEGVAANASSPTINMGIFSTGAGNNSSATSGLITSSPSNATDPNNVSSKESGGHNGLGSGAKAGIAVGVIVGILALIALIFLLLRRRKSKHVTAGGYYGDAPGISHDLREKESGVGIAALPVSASPTSDGALAGDAALIGRGNSARVVDGSHIEGGSVGRRATTNHTPAAAAAAAAAGVVRKPVGRSLGDEEIEGRDGALSAQSRVLNDDERARWEEEERRLDADIAEAERRRLA